MVGSAPGIAVHHARPETGRQFDGRAAGGMTHQPSAGLSPMDNGHQTTGGPVLIDAAVGLPFQEAHLSAHGWCRLARIAGGDGPASFAYNCPASTSNNSESSD
jgi:hypothetical protein